MERLAHNLRAQFQVSLSHSSRELANGVLSAQGAGG
jgi:hypothetical protein